MTCGKNFSPWWEERPSVLMFITSVLWRAVSPGVCQVVIPTLMRAGKPQQVWIRLILPPPGKVYTHSLILCISYLLFPLGGWVSRWGFSSKGPPKEGPLNAPLLQGLRKYNVTLCHW